ncbi:MAG: chloride channel protein [Acidobacteriota bacterium]|nr:chloride channel protein [Acidobacteriota bacterium]
MNSSRPNQPAASPAPPFSARLSAYFSSLLREREEQVFLILSLLIGALAGLAVVAFIVLTERLGMRLYPVGSPAWRRVAIPIVGSLIMGYLLYRFFPDARGSGVPQTKAALFAREGNISLRTVLGKFVCTSATLASGIPLGREGPSVQVGAGIASVLGRHLGLRPEKVKALIPVGAAAAIAAAFNTPMAAVLFALEEVVGDLHAPVLGSVVLASATSWAVLRLLLGNNPLFNAPSYTLVHPVEFLIYAVLGILGGFLSVAFTKMLLNFRHRFLLLPRNTRWWHPVVGGVTVGLMGWFVPQALGVGYAYVGQALHNNMALRLMVLLIVLKLFAITISYASGNAGGIFGPSLFLGSMLGGAVGTVAHHFLPAYTAEPGAYALVGMGALFAGIVRAPMTSVLMIFEMTRDYTVIVPLMIANLASLFISRRFQPEPIYEALAQQDGIHLPSASAREEMRGRLVRDAMRTSGELLSAGVTVREALEITQRSLLHSWPLEDEGNIVGVVTHAELRKLRDGGHGEAQLLALVKTLDFPHVHADHPLHLALERMSHEHLDVIPVVNRADIHKLEGVVTLRDVLESYGVDSLGSA